MSVPCWDQTRPGCRRDRRVTISTHLSPDEVCRGSFPGMESGLNCHGGMVATRVWLPFSGKWTFARVVWLPPGLLPPGYGCPSPESELSCHGGMVATRVWLPFSAAPVRPARRHCDSGVKDHVAVPPVGTRVSFFERSLLGPNSARLLPGPEGNIITHLIPVQRSPRVFPRAGKGQPVRNVAGYAPIASGILYLLSTVPVRTRAVHSPMPSPWALLALGSLASHGPSCKVHLPQPVHPLSATSVRSSRRHCNCGKKMV